MPLHRVANDDTIDSGDVDQFVDLLTGATADQPVTVANDVRGLSLTGADTGYAAARFRGAQVTPGVPPSGEGVRADAAHDVATDGDGRLWVRRPSGAWAASGIGRDTCSCTLRATFTSGVGSTWLPLEYRGDGVHWLNQPWFDGASTLTVPHAGFYQLTARQTVYNVRPDGHPQDVRLHVILQDAYSLLGGIAFGGAGSFTSVHVEDVLWLPAGGRVGMIFEAVGPGSLVQVWADPGLSWLTLTYLGGS